ncbi:hypothetical protein P872_12690 [Rhodonellum psychrophilum GCM71 = DSM 17998]|uniref:Leucine-binding protein domain-containing protein n=2 Tax=Rhodonellum TaxID=336827 RepID=U5BRQ9_9BACT|nr:MULTISPECIES: ABC transporter substrate-binding protein [Rhodonellum]ERM80578.1 hypothetical protein P872_12690 [Rhodonellum psychrophilum GCM71 = DSM 17998]SDZ51210.1 ABC-type branched-chain amino acid transport system, substrate-binding protein [Rhodonellum ikkaensis]
MENIGILLPKSSTHPEIGYDFFFGVKAFFAYHTTFNPSFHTANIGFGIDGDGMYSEAERMFLEKNVDVLVVFAEHPIVDKIFPLAAQFRRTILVVNPGAKYPIDWQAPDYVVFLTMGEMLSAKLAATHAVSSLGISKGINATNFYDGGYGIGDAFYLGQENAGGEIVFTFVSKHLETEFDPKPLEDFLEGNQEPMLIYAIYTGKILPLFLKALEGSHTQATLVCSAEMLHELIGSELDQKMSLPEIFACTSLSPEWKNKRFQPLHDFFKNEARREVSPFSYLGWDAGEVLQQLASASGADWKEKTHQLEKTPITGSRGAMKFHLKTGHFIGVQYQVQLQGKHLKVSKIELEEVLKEWEQFMETRPNPPQVGWFNTYLCS